MGQNLTKKLNTKNAGLVKSNPILPNWIGINDASNYCSLSPSTLNRAILRGTLKASRVTGKTLIKRKWIDKFLEGK